MGRISLDLFAGAGGLSCGLEMAGFTPILANEIEPEYAETYRHNHPDTRLVVDDIRTICEDDLSKTLGLGVGELDLLAGGPPCQGFSINAPIRSLDDKRNHLFRDYLRIAEVLQPKAVLIENVPGIISLGRGTVVEQIYKELDRIGYTVSHRILFAGHYGVPQMRFRTIFLAVRGRKRDILFPEPEYDATAVANFTGAKELCLHPSPLFTEMKAHTTVWDAVSDLPEIESGNNGGGTFEYRAEPQGWYQELLREGSPRIHNHVCNRLGKVNLERLRHIPQGGSWRDIPFDLLPAGLKRARRSDHTRRYGRLHPEQLCSTILTKCDPHWGSFFHPTQDRVISVREAARIQSFPDKYVFLGSVTKQYEQVGNAVPPLLAKALGEAINLMIEDAERKSRKKGEEIMSRDLTEIFGYNPDDLTKNVRKLWSLGACPFINKTCIKFNHDQTITYGTCSVTSPYGDIIICPNRLYADDYEVLKRVSADVFGEVPFMLYDKYIEHRGDFDDCIVALGKNSGREVQVGGSLSMDWVLARVSGAALTEYTGIEVQSIDITGNYRDAWHAYKNMKPKDDPDTFPSSQHGLNWANVHKRLIPQLIRKGVVYSRSSMVRKGMYFILPDIVYQKFEEVIGDIPTVGDADRGTLTVHTYRLGDLVPHGKQRAIEPVRELRFTLEEFSNRFISGPNLPSGDDLDDAIRNILGVK